MMAVVFSPLVLLLAPFVIVLLPFVVAVNIIRASNGSPRRSFCLLRETLRMICTQIFVYVPAMVPVVWYYITRANAPHAVRCHVPYEAYYVAWKRRRVAAATTTAFMCSSPTQGHQQLSCSPRDQLHQGKLEPNVVARCTPPVVGGSIGTSVLHQATGVILGFPPSTPLPYDPSNLSSPLGSSFNGSMTNSFTAESLAHHDGIAEKTVAFPARGRLSMCTLDVFSPLSSPEGRSDANATGLSPVVVFIHGGSWGWGNKWHYATLAHNLRTSAACCVVVPDYPTYPSGTILDMVESVHAVLQWVKDHATMYGGDPQRIHLVGHSAGAHLIGLWAVRRAMALLGMTCDALLHASSTDGAIAVKYDDDRRTIKGLRNPEPAVVAPIALLGLPRSEAARAKLRPHSSGRSPDAACVDFASGPNVTSLMMFAGVFDVKEHLLWQKRRCIDGISTMVPAVDGQWAACSPTILLTEMKNSWEGSAAEISRSRRSSVHVSPSGPFPPKIHFYHDAADEVVSFEQSVNAQQAWQRCLTALDASGSSSSRCPSVIPFPYGHSGIVLSSMGKPLPKRRTDAGAVPYPLVDEIARLIST